MPLRSRHPTPKPLFHHIIPRHVRIINAHLLPRLANRGNTVVGAALRFGSEHTLNKFTHARLTLQSPWCDSDVSAGTGRRLGATRSRRGQVLAASRRRGAIITEGSKTTLSQSHAARGLAAGASPTFAIPCSGGHSDMGGKMLINNGGIMTSRGMALPWRRALRPRSKAKPRLGTAPRGVNRAQPAATQKKPPQWGGS